MKKTLVRTRWLTMTALLSALAAMLQFFEISLPLMPSILKLELSDLPAMVGAILLGPVSGLSVELIKNLIHLTVTWSAGVGELCSFLIGACMVIPAGLIGRRYPTSRGALMACLAGVFSMCLGSFPINRFISYPFYAKFVMPMDVILDMYRAIDPKIENLWQALLVFNLPFTFLKGIVASVPTLLILPVLRKQTRKTESRF